MMASRRRDERGVTIVLVAICLVVIVGLVALVIDLAQIRQARADGKSAADFAARAGASNLPAGANEACDAALGFFAANVEGATTPGPCTGFSEPCNPSTPQSVSRTISGYSVTITHPVLDGGLDPDPIGSPSQAVDQAGFEGTPCERIAVSVSVSIDTLFAGILGVDTLGSSVQSVARSFEAGNEGEAVALLLLEPEACNALTTTGNGSIRVRATVDAEGNEAPGAIVVDSAGTGGTGSNNCNTGNRYTINPRNNPNNFIIAEATPGGIPGVIRSWALTGGNASKSFEPADVSAGRLDPQPTPSSQQVTRAPIDARYNCASADECDGGAPGVTNYIDQLDADFSGPGKPSAGGTWFEYPADYIINHPVEANDTNPGVTDPADGGWCGSSRPGAIDLPNVGNWWINCPGTLNIGQPFTSQGGNVVFEGGVDVGNSTFSTNSVNSDGVFVFMRNGGNFTRGSTGSVSMLQTMVFLDGGLLDIVGGSGTIAWSAPCVSGACSGYADQFEDLAFWSESAAEHEIGGQGTLDLEGVFFMPNAQPFNFSGQGAIAQLQAQFISRRLISSGQGTLEMTPDPERVVLIPLFGISLIR